jgi:anti-anti-sigma regulatory factor
MDIRISQSEDKDSGRVILRVEGRLTRDAAELLEGVCARFLSRSQASICINVDGINFISEDGAKALCRLKGLPQVRLDGCRLFTECVVEQARRFRARRSLVS